MYLMLNLNWKNIMVEVRIRKENHIYLNLLNFNLMQLTYFSFRVAAYTIFM